MSDPGRTLRVLIADDESLARTRIRRLIADVTDVEIVGEASNGDELQRQLPMLCPDLLLLDIEMPGSTVFETISTYAATASVSVVFISAHDRYALQAFDVEAIDFLLKPVSAGRLATAVERVRRRRASSAPGTVELLQAVRSLEARQRAVETARGADAPRFAQRILVRIDGADVPVLVATIESFEASHNCVGLRTAAGVYSVRGTLSALEASLDPVTFARIHRGIIVNLDHVQQVQPWFWGDAIIIMKRGARLRMSRRYRDAFHERFLAATGSGSRSAEPDHTPQHRNASPARPRRANAVE